jgi:hypothetical protein
MSHPHRIMIRPPPACVFIQHQTHSSVDMYLEFPRGKEDEVLRWFDNWRVFIEHQIRHFKMVRVTHDPDLQQKVDEERRQLAPMQHGQVDSKMQDLLQDAVRDSDTDPPPPEANP